MANGFSLLGSNFNSNIAGGAATSLGLGDQLGRQVQDETDEERKRRFKLLSDRAQLSASSIFPGGLGASTLFGGYGR